MFASIDLWYHQQGIFDAMSTYNSSQGMCLTLIEVCCHCLMKQMKIYLYFFIERQGVSFLFICSPKYSFVENWLL